MLKAIRTFKNVQARICRTSEGVWLPGWVVYLGQEEARIRLESFTVLKFDEVLIGECYGDGTLVRFGGKLAGQSGQAIAIAVSGSMTFEPSREAVRFQIENASGTLRTDAQDAIFVAMDVSPKSLGGLSDRSFAPRSLLRLSLTTTTGTFEAVVGVVSSVPDASGSGHFRLGLRIVSASRLDAAMWQRLLEGLAEDDDGQRTAPDALSWTAA